MRTVYQVRSSVGGGGLPPRARRRDRRLVDSPGLTNTPLAVLAEELRGVLEDVASGGSRIGSTPAGHRVRSFERVFLREVQQALCGTGVAARSESIQSIQSTVVRGSAVAGNDSGLALTMAELGRFSAIAVRAVERADRAALCRSASLSELAR